MYREFPCALCGEEGRRLVCSACCSDLPRLMLVCARCGLPSHNSVCAACLVNPPRWQHLVAPFSFAYPIDKIIHAFKYSGAIFWHSFLAAEMVRRGLTLKVPIPDVLIPVPMHPRRLADRGFNQALELARGIGREMDVPILAGATARTESGLPQVGLSAGKRWQNIRGAFTATLSDAAPRSVAIVDDILTTGATANELAQVLRRTGIKKIQVWVVARTQGPQHQG